MCLLSAILHRPRPCQHLDNPAARFMQRWLRFASGIDRVNEWVGRTLYWLTLAMVLIGSFNAIVRYLDRYTGLSLSSNTYIELPWSLFSLVFLLGAAYTYRHNAHVRVDAPFPVQPERAPEPPGLQVGDRLRQHAVEERRRVVAGDARRRPVGLVEQRAPAPDRRVLQLEPVEEADDVDRRALRCGVRERLRLGALMQVAKGTHAGHADSSRQERATLYAPAHAAGPVTRRSP